MDINSSLIASAHHYYVIFFRNEMRLKEAKLFQLFGVPKREKKVVVDKAHSLYYIHFQIELQRAYGAPSMMSLSPSAGADNKPSYWYDVYAANFEHGGEFFTFIAYPYVQMGKLFEKYFDYLPSLTTFFKPKLTPVFELMKDAKGIIQFLENAASVSVTKYSAQVKEQKAATKINIQGDNPLESEVFRIIDTMSTVQLETASLRLQCYRKERGILDLAFDRLGNYRIWIKRDGQDEALSLLSTVFQFFKDKGTLEQSNFITQVSLLENDS